MLRVRTIGLAAVLVLAGVGTVRAQVAWDSPLLLPPRPQGGPGIFLVDPAGGELGVLGMWRSGRAPNSLGFRVGLAEDNTDDVSVFGGVDVSGTMTRSSRDFPLDISWVAGGGVGVGDDVLLSFPLGITIGHTFIGDGAQFTPYVIPRVILDAFFGDGPGDDDSDLDLDAAFDLGVDIGFQRGWVIRFGATFAGDRDDALAIGIVF
ncbi:MAG TPA: hypothetical protein VF188_17220 [Longimicrobiales bacterium]